MSKIRVDGVEIDVADAVQRVVTVPRGRVDCRHGVSFHLLFHGTAALICERLKRFHRKLSRLKA